MNIVFVSRKHGHARTLNLGRATLTGAAVVFGLLLMAASITFYHVLTPLLSGDKVSSASLDPRVLSAWNARLQAQRDEIEKLKQHSSDQIDAMTLRLGQMQARLMRLDALGQRLTHVAKLDEGEFNFEDAPAQGGPLEVQPGDAYQMPDLQKSLDDIEAQIEHRAQQLELLNELFANRQLNQDRFVAGRPVEQGWLSSHFGYRTDPFTGQRAWHPGIDFAGKSGSDIVAVAAGVVTAAEEHGGYGLMVEINHGNGLSTRYGHCKKLLVKVGDIVRKGQVLARMGSTGRSTGPHVHFEVLKEGHQVDPLAYINRAGD